MSILDFIDKHADGLGFLLFLVILAITDKLWRSGRKS